MSTAQADLRAAAVELLAAYATSAGTRLNTNPARPRMLYGALPSAWVDEMHERITYDGIRQRFPVAVVTVVWGLYDSGEAVARRDAFVDGFLDWWSAEPDAASANSVSGITAIDDLPAYQPDWTERQDTFYATRFTVEGYAG